MDERYRDGRRLVNCDQECGAFDEPIWDDLEEVRDALEHWRDILSICLHRATLDREDPGRTVEHEEPVINPHLNRYAISAIDMLVPPGTWFLAVLKRNGIAIESMMIKAK